MACVKTMAAALLLEMALAGAVQAQPASRPPALGVYKHSYDNSDVSGDHFKSENILEVTAYKPDANYIRLHLEFYNGHMCDIRGMATITPSALVYHDPMDSNGTPCTLTLQEGADGVHIFEAQEGACRNETCGARGGYGYSPTGTVDFKRLERAPIRYMPLLLGSREYRTAAAEYEGGHATP